MTNFILGLLVGIILTGVLEELLEEISYKALPAYLVDKIVIDAGKCRTSSWNNGLVDLEII